MPPSLDYNSVWLITGCSSGLGQALAKHVHDLGFSVIATARDVSSLSYLPDGPKVLKLRLDVSSSESISSALEFAVKRFGRLDVLVNNAGFGSMGESEGYSEDIARELFETNFWGAAHMMQASIPIFRDINAPGKGGVIVQVSSIGGCVAFPGSSFYHASKFALEGFTKSVAKELNPKWNIKVMIVSPGGMATSFFQNSKSPDRLPIYAEDPETPLNQLFASLSSSGAMDSLPTPERCAAVIAAAILGRDDKPLPTRLNLGQAPLFLVRSDMKASLQELENWESESLSVQAKEDGDAASFLKK
ncbi:hypothetical protein BX600DRAFT_440588 [Xylariales sp. PMI_506]|nr:hypothetical protein BX600DRAFT_440588 [Xylariales sp. PMI_506]